jgi:hypothetical protein
MRDLGKITLCLVRAMAALALVIPASARPVVPTPADAENIKLATDIFKQLIEIDTSHSVGSTTIAAEGMAKRLREAGFPAADVVVMGPDPRRGNMIARLHGTGAHKPVLLIGHLDVVEAKRTDWTTDPFQFIEKDGYYYGAWHTGHERWRRHHDGHPDPHEAGGLPAGPRHHPGADRG